jgi:hypothetical protein
MSCDHYECKLASDVTAGWPCLRASAAETSERCCGYAGSNRCPHDSPPRATAGELNVDASVPRDEIRFQANGKTIATITGLATAGELTPADEKYGPGRSEHSPPRILPPEIVLAGIEQLERYGIGIFRRGVGEYTILEEWRAHDAALRARADRQDADWKEFYEKDIAALRARAEGVQALAEGHRNAPTAPDSGLATGDADEKGKPATGTETP